LLRTTCLVRLFVSMSNPPADAIAADAKIMLVFQNTDLSVVASATMTGSVWISVESAGDPRA